MQSVSKKAVFLLCLTWILTGCNDVTDFNWGQIDKGTLKAFDKCIAQSSKSLSEKANRRICTKKHSSQVDIETIGKTIGSVIYRYSDRGLSGIMINKSDDYVLTGMTVNIQHEDNKDSNGKVITEKCKIDGIWIEPNDEGVFSCKDLIFTPSKDRTYNKLGEKVLTWWGSNTFGIKVNY